MAASSPERSLAVHPSLSLQNFTTTLERRCDIDYGGKEDLNDWCRRFCWNPNYSSFTGVGSGGLSSGYNKYSGPSGYQPSYNSDYNDGWGADCWMYCGDVCRNQCSGAQILIQT
ncbi:hypothetical protein BGX26_012372, partial [Mortierella sp. AD094]